MVLSELIKRFRTLAHDTVEPYFTSDDILTAWLNDAVSEAAIRGRLIHVSDDPAVCEIQVLSWSSRYDLHETLYELSRTRFDPANGAIGRSVCLVSTETLDNTYYPNWRTMTGTPQFAVQDDTSIRLIPTPDVDGVLRLEGYCVPMVDMVLPTDAPKIHRAHHVHLVQWALHRAFSVPDSEFFDPERSDRALNEFELYFGLRPSSNLRRITREDKPQNIEPFMP